MSSDDDEVRSDAKLLHKLLRGELSLADGDDYGHMAEGLQVMFESEDGTQVWVQLRPYAFNTYPEGMKDDDGNYLEMVDAGWEELKDLQDCPTYKTDVEAIDRFVRDVGYVPGSDDD